jgi:peptide/nickel transport system substrate-binding protein
MRDLKQLKLFHALGLLVVLSMLLGACAAPAGTQAPAGGEQAASAPAAEEEQILNILYWQAPTILNSHQGTGTKDIDAGAVILEPLATYNQNDELIPVLAAEIPTVENGGVAADGTSVTWKLKEGLKWSDGTDVTADDIIFTWQYCADPATACTTTSKFSNIAGIEALDPLTVKITWTNPTPFPYDPYVSYYGHILQKAQFGNCIGAAAINDAACQAANLAPIGTNAYQLVEFKPGDTVVYERNPNFRDAANVYFDKVVIKGGGDATSAARAVCETGEVDYAWNLQVQKAVLEPILAAGKCDAVQGGSFGVERIHLNFANPDPALGDKRSEPDQPHPFLSDVKVRQAIAKAIDRQGIDEQLYGPTGEATCNIAVSPASINSPNTTCDQDVEGAKALLAEAGWADTNGDGTLDKDGVEMKVLYQTSINPLRQGEQAIVKQNLEEIGIGVELKSVDAGVFFSGDAGNPDTINKFFADLQMYTNSPSSPDVYSYFADYICANLASSTNNWQSPNYSRHCDPEFDKLADQYLKEFDPAKRTELAIAMNDYLIENAVVLPLINRATPSGKAKNLEGPTYQTFEGNLWNIATWKRSE